MPCLDDLIGFKDNKLKINVEGKEKEYEVNYLFDNVLKECGFINCAEVGEKIDIRLNDWSL